MCTGSCTCRELKKNLQIRNNSECGSIQNKEYGDQILGSMNHSRRTGYAKKCWMTANAGTGKKGNFLSKLEQLGRWDEQFMTCKLIPAN